MTDPERADETQPDKGLESKITLGAVSDESDSAANSNSSGEPPPKLTAEEQMALYEDYLKENDWGHQPC